MKHAVITPLPLKLYLAMTYADMDNIAILKSVPIVAQIALFTKYLPIPKKIPYNIRMPKPLLDKLNAYAELTGNTTTDVVINALNDFIKDKTVFNTYLSDIKGVSIKLPVVANEKAIFINSNINVDESYSAYDSFVDLAGYDATTEAYEILKIPNNLDSFNEAFGYITPVENVIAKGKHSGIEFVVLPDVYSYYDNDVFDALYCFYFEVEMDRLKTVKLIDYMDAINKANAVGNLKIKNNLISCVNDLEYINSCISPEADVDVGDGVDLENFAYENLEVVAKKYNTGNIIKLGANIDDAIVDAELKENPHKFQALLDDRVEFVVGEKLSVFTDVVRDEIAAAIDEKVDIIETMVKDGKSKDEILTAIAESRIKTKK